MKINERRERTKKYLKQISVFNARISRRKKWIQELEAYKEHMDPERYQKYIDQSLELIEGFTNKRDELISQIVTLPDQYADLLLLLYVKDIRVTELPEIMSFGERWIFRRVNTALDLFYQRYGANIDYVIPMEEDNDQ